MVKKQKMLKKESQDNYATEKINVISNCLLGEYNKNNEYDIPEAIKEELIAVRKVKKSVYQNSVFCGAVFEQYGDLLFEVTFSKNTVKNVAMCELFVLEQEQKINGYIQNTIRTKVGQYVDELENFIEKAYAHFNIVLTENGGKEYKLDEDISIEAYIGAKRNFNINMAKLTKKEYNRLYKNYVSSRLSLLKKINSPYTQSILEKFNEEYAKIEKYFLDDKNYKSVSELLDKCIEDCTGINPQFAEQEKELMDQMKPIVDDFSKQAETIAREAEPKAMDGLNREDRTRNEEMERQQADATRETTRVKQEPVSESVSTFDGPSSAPSSSSRTSTGSQRRGQPAKEDKDKQNILEEYSSSRSGGYIVDLGRNKEDLSVIGEKPTSTFNPDKRKRVPDKIPPNTSRTQLPTVPNINETSERSSGSEAFGAGVGVRPPVAREGMVQTTQTPDTPTTPRSLKEKNMGDEGRMA